jgi:hypothetical protein
MGKRKYVPITSITVSIVADIQPTQMFAASVR